MQTFGDRYYAIRHGDWVEIRHATKPIKAIHSRFVRRVEPLNWYNPSTFVMKQVFYKGGKIVLSISARHWSTISKGFGLPRLRKDGIIQLPLSTIEKIGRMRGIK